MDITDKLETLSTLLRTPDLHPQALFQKEDIAQKIFSDIDTFTRYCRTHSAFSRNMISLALCTSHSLLEDPLIKSAVYAATEVLCCEETEIAGLFFEENIQMNADQQTLSEEEWEQSGQNPLVRHQLVTLVLQILTRPQSNESSLGYLQRIFAFLVRHNADPLLFYLQTHPKQLELLLTNLKYPSISILVSQLLAAEDKSKLYKYEKLKRRIIQYAVGELFERVEDEEYFDGVMILVEEIFNTTKQGYFEYADDFTRLANLLVSHDVMQRFLDLILERHQPSFKSASVFLQLLFARINSERDQSSFYHKKQKTEPSMNFQVDVFFENMPALIDLASHIDNFHALTKISYLSFLEGLFKCSKLKKYSFNLCQPAFIGLLDSFSKQNRGGVYKNKLYNLINLIIASTTPQEINLFLNDHQQLWEKYFTSIKNADLSNPKAYNTNQTAAFEVALISQVTKKNEKAIDKASQAVGKDLRKLFIKQETKIASLNNNTYLSPQKEAQEEKIEKETNLSPELQMKDTVITLPNSNSVQSSPITQKQSIVEPSSSSETNPNKINKEKTTSHQDHHHASPVKGQPFRNFSPDDFSESAIDMSFNERVSLIDRVGFFFF